VRELLRDRAARVIDARVAPLPYHAFVPGRLLQRVAGEATVHGRRTAWSLVRKVVTRTEWSARLHDNVYWRREANAYASGLLASLPNGLAAPRLLALERPAPGVVALWLEEIEDAQAGR